jgi:2-keto-4-pentenoate hydratase
MPAIDVLDSRFAGYQFSLPDVIADNASAGAFVLGAPIQADGIDLELVGCVFSRNGNIVDTAAGAETMGHPADAVAWLVQALAGRGRILPAGSIVLSGALTAASPIAAGDSYLAEFDRIGSVSLAAHDS